jgi:O-antigen/teichoic acid export membrane protein
MAKEGDNSLAKLAKESTTYFFARYFDEGLLLVTSAFVTRMLGAELYGLFTLGRTVMGMFSQFCRMGMNTGLIRFASAYYGKRDKPRFMGAVFTALGISLALSLLSIFVLSVFAGPLSVKVFKMPELRPVLLIYALCIPLDILLVMLSSISRAVQDQKYGVLANFIILPMLRLLLFVGALFAGLGLLGINWAHLISMVGAVTFGGLLFLRKHGQSFIGGRPQFETGKFLRVSIPLFLTGYAMMAMRRIDRIMIGMFSDSAAVGIYSVASNIAYQLTAIFLAFNWVFSPMVADLFHKQQTEQIEQLYKTSARWSFILSFPLLMIIVFCSKLLMGIFGAEFVAGWQTLIILAIAFLSDNIGGYCGTILKMTGKQDTDFLFNLSMLGLNVVLNYFLIRKFGALGAAIATGIAIFVVNVIRTFNVYRLFKLNPFDGKFLKSVALGLAAAAPAMALFFLLKRSTMVSIFATVLFLGIYALLVLKNLEEEDRVLLDRVRKRLQAGGRRKGPNGL